MQLAKYLLRISFLLLSPAFSIAQLNDAGKMMAQGSGEGEFSERIKMSINRLTSTDYFPVFTERFILADVDIQANNPRRFYNFSGDLSGRYIEVMSLLNIENTGVNLHDLVAKVLKCQRGDGRFGNSLLEFTGDQIGSQHMALLWGNGRMLVGLMQYYGRFKDKDVLQAAKRLGDFFIKTYAVCSSPEISKKLEGFGATGIICFTQYIEGLVMLSEFSGDKRYAEIAANVYPVLPERGRQHSHGYLTTLRGILNLYKYDKNDRHLQYVINAFNSLLNSPDYTVFGSVREYFGKAAVDRDEGCSTADFTRLCFDLYSLTGKMAYLEKGEFALLNALYFNQYYTGDFGHHLIRGTGADPHYEHAAWWCCTMHGLRAMYDLHEHQVIVRDGHRNRLNLYLEGVYANGFIGISVRKGKFEQEYHYYDITVNNSTDKQLALRIPSWCSDHNVILNGQKLKIQPENGYANLEGLKRGDKISIGFLYRKIIRTAGSVTDLSEIKNDVVKGVLQYGPYLMGVDDKIDHTFTAEPNDNLVFVQSIKSLSNDLRNDPNISGSRKSDAYLSAGYKHGGFPSYLQTILRPVSELTRDKHGYLMLDISYSRKDVSSGHNASMLAPWKP